MFNCNICGKSYNFQSDLETHTTMRHGAGGSMGGGVTINRPPRDGYMAFVRSPDGISIELLQQGMPLPPAAPWQDMPNTGTW